MLFNQLSQLFRRKHLMPGFGFSLDEMIGPLREIAFGTIYNRINKILQMAGSFENIFVHDISRFYLEEVIIQAEEEAAPEIFKIMFEFCAQVTIVIQSSNSPINLRRRIHEAFLLAESCDILR